MTDWNGALREASEVLSCKVTVCVEGSGRAQGGSLARESRLSKRSPPHTQLDAGKATHSSILAWRIPLTEEPAGLQVYKVTKGLT